jgi:hypothetical protein
VSKHLVGYSVDYAYEVLGIRDVQVVLADDADAEVAKWQELRSAAVKGMKRHQERSRELTKRLNIRGNEVASLKAQLAAALNAQAGVVAWRYKVGGEWHASSRPPTAVAMWNDIEEVVPLYAAPQPQAEPVGAAVPDSHRVRLERMRREFSLTTFERARFWADECRMIVEALLAMAQQQPSPQASAEDVVAWAQRLDDGYDSAESPAYVEFYRRDVVESVIREMRASLGVGRE